ncbi:hypothetical protein D3C81_1494060 [compost metagenome]
MGYRRQQLHALLQVVGDAALQGIEGAGSVGHLAWSALVQVRTGGVRVEVVDRLGQAGQRTDSQAHRQPGAEQQQRQLQKQDDWQPLGHRDWPGGDVHGQRAAIVQYQVRLEVRRRPGNVFEAQGVALADGPLDGGRGHVWLGHVHRLAGQALIEAIAVVAPVQQRKPGGTFFRR